MATLSEWMKMLHANRGKQVQLTLVRNKKEETVTLEARKGKNHGELLMPDILSLDGDVEPNGELAELNNQFEPETLTLQVQPTIELQDLQKQLEDQQQNADQQVQQLQQQIEILNLDPIAIQMQ
jgi:serine protease Do